jgi:hypothetical protein
MKKETYNCFAKYRQHLLSVLTFLAIIFIIISCNKFKDDFDPDKVANPNWNPEFAIPLINSTLTISDFFEDSNNFFIQVNPDNSLSFIYGIDEIFSPDAEEIIDIPDQNFSYQTQIAIPPLPPGAFDTVNYDYNYQFLTDTTGQRLDSIILKNGEMNFTFKTNLNRDQASVKIVIPDIVHQVTGKYLEIAVSINNPGGQLEWIEHEEFIPIGEYKILLNEEKNGSNANNEITFLVEVIIYGDNNPDLSPYDFIFSGRIRNLEFHQLFGYLANYTIDFKDSLNISIFEKTITGGIQLGPNAIDVFVDIKNSFGTPVTFAAEEFYAHSGVNPPYDVDIYLYGIGVPNIFTINAPTINQVGQTIETNLDFSNSNLDEAFNIAPEKLYFDFMAVTNPDGDTLASNFILDTSRISLGVDLEVQLFTAISNFVVEDTVAFDLNSSAGEIDNLLIRLNAVNRFPLDALVQIYFADDNYNILDSLINDPDERILVGAPVGGPPEYRVIDSAYKMTDFAISKQKLDRILGAEYIMLKAGLSTTDNSLVKIYNDYSLSIKIGTIVGMDIDSE